VILLAAVLSCLFFGFDVLEAGGDIKAAMEAFGGWLAFLFDLVAASSCVMYWVWVWVCVL
jgi:hypothetical protein